MKSGVGDIIGKSISQVVVAESSTRPKEQVFLIFSDGTYLELYGDSFNCAGGLNNGDVTDAKQYVEKMNGKILKIYE